MDIDPAVDPGGGFYVGWTTAGEWLNYTVEVGTAGNYLLEIRYASKGAGSTLHLEAKGANVTGSIAVPDTGAWQTWRTLSKPVTLTAGRQSLRLVFDTVGVSGGAANVNWLRLSPAGAKSAPFLSTGPANLPGIVQSEAFDAGGESVAYHDTTHGNAGGAYRSTNADIASTTDTGGGYLVGWTRAGEWLNYTVTVATTRTYTLSARVASNGTGGTFHVEFNGVDKTGPDRRRVHRRVEYVQDHHEDGESGGRHADHAGRDGRERADHGRRELQLRGRAGVMPGRMRFGDQARVTRPIAWAATRESRAPTRSARFPR